MWNVVVLLILVYTGTVFPFWLCFIQFAMPPPVESTDESVVETVEFIIDVLFLVDLFANFFFSYKDQHGREVTDTKAIASRYLRGYFTVNLVACIPTDVIAWVISSSDRSNNTHKLVRMTRLRRISRLARLVRLVRLTKAWQLLSGTQYFKWAHSIRGVRVLNFLGGLIWTIHILACGWFLVASLHVDHQETWVGRRQVEPDGTTLLERQPFEQWITAMYFVLTIFTTVGFGDMAATTVGEIGYVVCIMLIGAVVHSIIVSEVIGIITSVDGSARKLSEQKELVDVFSKHAELDNHTRLDLTNWIESSRTALHAYDPSQMRQLLTSSVLPRHLSSELPQAMFSGKLVNNKFLRINEMLGTPIPARLCLLIAVASTVRFYDTDELVYCSQEHAWNLFLVLEGTFANIGKPTAAGGIADLPPIALASLEKQVSSRTPTGRKRLSFGDSCEALKMSHSSLEKLTPYQLFGVGNYFGETELLLEENPIPRRSCTRCQSRHGGLLVLPRDELQNIAKEFPSFMVAWQAAARRREHHRTSLLERLVSDQRSTELAAKIIQRHVRLLLLPGSQSKPGDESAKSSIRFGPQMGIKNSTTSVAHSFEAVNCLRNDMREFHSGVQKDVTEMQRALTLALQGIHEELKIIRSSQSSETTRVGPQSTPQNNERAAVDFERVESIVDARAPQIGHGSRVTFGGEVYLSRQSPEPPVTQISRV